MEFKVVKNPIVIKLPDDIKLTIVNDHEIKIARDLPGGIELKIDTECLTVFDPRDEDKDPYIDC
ncbi:hypothetical protein A3C77_03630 [Candidatus Giovannonibacteria bacterium RIFCSPHIGHO2_02_FULL_45_13]|nr:MAG: hypothetical protein A3C77_03630 [Candidatus Giovannonibacteria bacterium RIFCSPHIGHO2_02_FULL_45_13]